MRWLIFTTLLLACGAMFAVAYHMHILLWAGFFYLLAAASMYNAWTVLVGRDPLDCER